MSVKPDYRLTLAMAAAVTALIAMPASADPLVTAACDVPKGVTQGYGVSDAERFVAKSKGVSPPRPHLVGPEPDTWDWRPTIIVDSGLKKASLLWTETPEQIKQRDEAKRRGELVSDLPPAEELSMLQYSPTAIIGVMLTPTTGGADVYALYPKLGVALISLRWGNDTYARQISWVAKCEFSWSRTR
jgi:uncharacterized membrane protein